MSFLLNFYLVVIILQHLVHKFFHLLLECLFLNVLIALLYLLHFYVLNLIIFYIHLCIHLCLITLNVLNLFFCSLLLLLLLLILFLFHFLIIHHRVLNIHLLCENFPYMNPLLNFGILGFLILDFLFLFHRIMFSF